MRNLKATINDLCKIVEVFHIHHYEKRNPLMPELEYEFQNLSDCTASLRFWGR